MNFDDFDAILLDLDGTIYHEEHALPGAVELIRKLQDERRRFACLSNSTSSPGRIAARLHRMGVSLDPAAIYTAGAAAADYILSPSPGTPGEGRGGGSCGRTEDAGLRTERKAESLAQSSVLSTQHSVLPEYRERGLPPRVYSLATEGVRDLLEGKVHWVSSPTESCDVVLVGTPSSLYATEDRQRVALEILRGQRGALLLGMCADRVYPSPRGIEFGSGALTAMLAYAADVRPIYTGKPEPIFFRELCRRLGVATERCVLIGDNLESDIAGGRNVGMRTVLVLTGVARREDLERLPADRQPHEVIETLAACS